MADAPAPSSLDSFFAKKKKKNVKSTNLNHDTVLAKEEKKKVVKNKDEEEWEDEQEMAAPIMQVQVAGMLNKEEDTIQEQSAGAAWRKQKKPETRDLNDKKFPTLAKAIQSSNINIDDGSNPNINIKTNKNVFAALEDEDGSEDEIKKRPKEIKPAMVKKQRGEMQSQAVQREVSRYVKDEKPKRSEESEEEEEAGRQSRRQEKLAEKAKSKAKGVVQEEEPEEVADDVKIEADEKASRAKYVGRAKLPTLLLPRKELQEAKPIKAQPAGKKKRFCEDEKEKPKLLVADWD